MAIAVLAELRTNRCWSSHKDPVCSKNNGDFQVSHRIHGTGIFTYMNGWFFMTNVSKYTSPMDPMGYIFAVLDRVFPSTSLKFKRSTDHR